MKYKLTDETMTTESGVVLHRIECVEWHKQGCAWQSLAMGAAWYGALSIGGCVLVDEILKERR